MLLRLGMRLLPISKAALVNVVLAKKFSCSFSFTASERKPGPEMH